MLALPANVEKRRSRGILANIHHFFSSLPCSGPSSFFTSAAGSSFFSPFLASVVVPFFVSGFLDFAFPNLPKFTISRAPPWFVPRSCPCRAIYIRIWQPAEAASISMDVDGLASLRGTIRCGVHVSFELLFPRDRGPLVNRLPLLVRFSCMPLVELPSTTRTAR